MKDCIEEKFLKNIEFDLLTAQKFKTFIER